MRAVAPKSWRDVIKVHPAADLFPMMSAEELKVLGEDIKNNGLRSRVAVLEGTNDLLLDGRNKLDAMEAVGLPVVLEDVAISVACGKHRVGFDPYAYVVSCNLTRRHLSAEDKRDVIAKLLKATPEKSNRAVAGMVKASHHTVEAVRTEMESTGQIAQLEKTVGKDGKARKQPAKRRRTEDDFRRDMAAKRTTQPEPGIEDEIEDPENYRSAYLIRADQAIRFAAYSGPISQDIVDLARRVSRVWAELANKLEAA